MAAYPIPTGYTSYEARFKLNGAGPSTPWAGRGFLYLLLRLWTGARALR
jgi:hypothetical protein